MISIIADTHTHSLACDHAYSTITENALAAKQKGLKFLSLTEHSPSLPGAPTYLHFSSLKMLPRYVHGVMLLRGAEVNIMDYEGALDLPDRILENLEWVIASMHIPNLTPGTNEEHTRAWMNVAQNPLVDVIGHCGDARYEFDHKTVIKEFASTGKIVEINDHSFHVRPGSRENCRKVAVLCAEYRVPIVVSSDAHFHHRVGCFETAVAMLEEIGFPRELIINADFDRFLRIVREKSGKMLTDEA